MTTDVQRQGPALDVDGVPCPDPDTTSSILQGILVGAFLSAASDALSGRVLDLGAGNQPYRRFLEGHCDQVVAVDPTLAEGLHAVAMSEHLPFADAAFDVVVATEVLEHVGSIDATMREIARVVRPGGRLLVTVPFVYPIHEAPYDNRRLTHHGLRRLFGEHAFEVERLRSKGGVPTLVLVVLTTVMFRLLRLAGGRTFGSRSGPHPTRRLALALERYLVTLVQSGKVARGEHFGRMSLGYSVVGRRV